MNIIPKNKKKKTIINLLVNQTNQSVLSARRLQLEHMIMLDFLLSYN
jgi:hypothetical protein